jgi:hypothetical protein
VAGSATAAPPHGERTRPGYSGFTMPQCLNPAFTMPPDFVNRVGFSATDSMFPWHHRGPLSIRLSGLCHDPTDRGYVSIADVQG